MLWLPHAFFSDCICRNAACDNASHLPKCLWGTYCVVEMTSSPSG